MNICICKTESLCCIPETNKNQLYSNKVKIFLKRDIVVQLLSHVQLFVTPWTAAHQASLSFTLYQSLRKLLSIKSVMPSNHLIFCCPFLLLPSIFPSIRVFSNELALCIRWPKYWSISFSISPSNEYSGLTGLISLPSNSLALSFLYGPVLTSIHDYWENHSFDYTDLCQQSDVSAF